MCASVLVQRSPDKPRTTRALALLVAATALPFAMIKHGLLGPVTGALGFLPPLAALVPLVAHSSYPPPAGNVAFSCPFVPWVPLAGVVSNLYLSVELSVFAWIRLLVVWAALGAYYVWVAWRETERGGGGRAAGLRLLEKDGGVVIVRSASPSESLRRRSSRQSTGGGGAGGVECLRSSIPPPLQDAAAAGDDGGGSSPLRRPLILVLDGAAVEEGEDIV